MTNLDWPSNVIINSAISPPSRLLLLKVAVRFSTVTRFPNLNLNPNLELTILLEF